MLHHDLDMKKLKTLTIENKKNKALCIEDANSIELFDKNIHKNE
jgi:hypothetical protein